MLIALSTWAALLLFTHYVPPNSIISFIAFFLILSVCLTSTFAPISYLFSRSLLTSRRHRITVRHAIRQGALLSLVVVLNLLLRALHSWSVVMGIVLLVAAIVIEILFLARK
jgi:hypothetical protein